MPYKVKFEVMSIAFRRLQEQNIYHGGKRQSGQCTFSGPDNMDFLSVQMTVNHNLHIYQIQKAWIPQTNMNYDISATFE